MSLGSKITRKDRDGFDELRNHAGLVGIARMVKARARRVASVVSAELELNDRAQRTLARRDS